MLRSSMPLALFLGACSSEQLSPTWADASNSVTAELSPVSVTTAGTHQTLIAARDGQSCFSVQQDFASPFPAVLQSVFPNGSTGNPLTLNGTEFKTLGWGEQRPNGDFVFPYQSVTGLDHGLVMYTGSGQSVDTVNLATAGLTGIGASFSNDNSTWTIANNGIYGDALVAFDQASSLVQVDANGQILEEQTLADAGNATGLTVLNGEIIVASAGDYFRNPQAEGSLSVVKANGTTETFAAPAGLGLNGNLSEQNGFVLLTGSSTESPIAIYHNSSVQSLELPPALQQAFTNRQAFVPSAVFVESATKDHMHFVFNVHNYATGTMTIYSAKGSLTSGDFTFDEIATLPAHSGTGILRLNEGQLCLATNDSTGNKVSFINLR